MIASGYLLTTAVVGLFLRSRTRWAYPATAALLFIAHEQIFFKGLNTPDASDLKIQAAGAGVVFVCTLIGGHFWRKGMLRPPVDHQF
jgi:hypothetical protein